ncbi:hypothetical protein WISP_20388 [Willisornis vidua]|uniref:Uncharacterized protein n=1 Tax=Willisornis vidua TaxID=1566151 RepID=A0ABQ9DN76_9PASS|nr:hypothetical protein WISP_20388 [Willisornis vidua]
MDDDTMKSVCGLLKDLDAIAKGSETVLYLVLWFNPSPKQLLSHSTQYELLSHSSQYDELENQMSKGTNSIHKSSEEDSLYPFDIFDQS